MPPVTFRRTPAPFTFASGRLFPKFRSIRWPNFDYILHESARLRGSMKNLQLLAVAAAAAVLPLGYASDGPDGISNAYVPPVMREAGTAHTAIFTLPVPPKILDGPPPVLRHAHPEYPAEFVLDAIAYLESRLDQWQQSDASTLLGPSLRQRAPVGDEGKPNGVIYAYSDPLHHYREFELDFEGDSGKLRTVFLYPQKMSWRECRARLRIARFHGRRGQRPYVLFLPEPPPGCTGRRLGKRDQSRDLLKPRRRPVRLSQQCSRQEKIGV